MKTQILVGLMVFTDCRSLKKYSMQGRPGIPNAIRFILRLNWKTVASRMNF